MHEPILQLHPQSYFRYLAALICFICKLNGAPQHPDERSYTRMLGRFNLSPCLFGRLSQPCRILSRTVKVVGGLE